MTTLLDNIFWHALTGPQAAVAAGAGEARRYARGFSPIAAFADPARPALDTLAAFCDSGEALYTAGWSGPVPAGWRVSAEATMFCMVWDAPTPAADTAVPWRALGAADAEAALALATLTKPGPFGPRTIELGDYIGCFDGQSGQLLAMAGERSFAGGCREISGVCTHPSQQGRGLAKRLMLELIRRQRARGETPFLHVMSANTTALGLYRRMGFRDHGEPVVRVILRG